jgi:serine/threonine protein phosphatase 1
LHRKRHSRRFMPQRCASRLLSQGFSRTKASGITFESRGQLVISALRKLFGAGSAPAREGLPEGVRIYAVGDIHGRVDLLRRILTMIAADLDKNPCRSVVEVFLGDYIDRGPSSREVIATLLSHPPVGGERHCLRGNHEQAMLDFLQEPGVLVDWSRFGGFETLLSYGLTPRLPVSRNDAMQLRDALAAALPQSHLGFLRATELSHARGGYFFVHAGIKPGLSLEAQSEDDLLWIREPFLFSQRDHGKIIVHGHTPNEEPEVMGNRINIDTGAFLTGRLTCLVLEGQGLRFFDTRSRGT